MAQEFTPQYTFKEDRLNELKQLFPEAWEDGVFNVDTLKELIGEFSTDNTAKEHFGLNWVGKQDARRIAAKPPTGTLKPCIGEGVNENTTENIFIEGENLEVLKILRKSYMGKIKMIYIDPPYNTGNDFIYNDTFADSTEDYLRKTGEKSDEGLLVSNPKSSGKYHANWLSFMYPRLRLAKDLLKEDGVIFISIDDNEVENLKSLCNEVLGEENHIIDLIWNLKSGTQAGHFTRSHEYILTYSKDKSKLNYFKDRTGGTIIHGALKKIGVKNPSSEITFPVGFECEGEDRVLQGEIGGSEKQFIKDKMVIQNNALSQEVTIEAGWAMKNQVLSFIDGKPTFDSKGQKIIRFYFNSSGILFYEKERGTFHPKSITTDLIGNTKSGGIEVTDLFGSKVFDYPKPTTLLEFISELVVEKDDIVMDFFAGSGSMGQSLMALNRANRYILIQLPEEIKPTNEINKEAIRHLLDKNLSARISELSKERLRLAIAKYYSSQGFKVYKQDTSTIYKWQEFVPEQDGALPDFYSQIEAVYKNPLIDGTQTQDFITEVILQEGFPLTSTQEEVASGIFKITHEWVPYTLYATMLYSFKNTDFETLSLEETDHFVCLDKAFDGNDALKQSLDNTCKLYTI